MKSEVRIGISGGNYAGWRGVFYPKGWPHRRELEFASRAFNSIEINGSFYSLQRPTSYRHWYEETPENFLFSVKGARFITHMKKLREVEVPLANFFASGVLALEKKLGPILGQFPPNFGWNEKRFREFFQLLPKTTGPDCTLFSARRASLASSHAGDREARTETVAQRTAAEGCETRCSQKKIRGARFIRLL